MLGQERQSHVLFDEVLTFLASTPTPEQIIASRPSEKLQERLRHLLNKNRNAGLTEEESAELEEFSRLNHSLSMQSDKFVSYLHESCHAKTAPYQRCA